MSEWIVACPICGKPYMFYDYVIMDQSACRDCQNKAGGGIGGRTVECPICGKPYKFYPYYVGDQSACPSCREKAYDRLPKWS